MLEAMKRSMFGVALAASFVAAMFVADSQAQGILPQTQASVEIVDRSEGRVLPLYWHQGRRYVVGKPGNEYTIRVRNGGSGRVLAVMSVDGVNVITGDTASPQQSGYVLAPYESADIAGWRKSMARTAAFYFTALPDSYAARTGRPDNVGVIGVAVYRRKQAPQPIAPLPQSAPYGRGDGAPAMQREAAAAERSSAAQAAAKQEDSRLGTGHGRRETSYVQNVAFERASVMPGETITLYYDSYRNLVARGVIREPVPVAPLPRPFHG